MSETCPTTIALRRCCVRRSSANPTDSLRPRPTKSSSFAHKTANSITELLPVGTRSPPLLKSTRGDYCRRKPAQSIPAKRDSRSCLGPTEFPFGRWRHLLIRNNSRFFLLFYFLTQSVFSFYLFRFLFINYKSYLFIYFNLTANRQ